MRVKNKIAILTDTNSGLSPGQADAHGVELVPMPVMLNGETFFEHQTITQEDFFIQLGQGASVKTSQPAPYTLLEAWERLLEKHEQVIYIPMSSGLSGSYDTAAVMAREYQGRVYPVNNRRISVTLQQSVLEARFYADQGMTAEEIVRFLGRDGLNASIYLAVNTLEYLKRSGRITPAGAAIGTMLNMKPVLQIQGGKLDAFAKCRGVKSAKKTIIRAVTDGVVNEFGGLDAPKPGAWLGFAYTHNHDAAETFLAEAKEAFPGFDIHADELPMSIATHVGPGSLAMTCTKVLPGGVQYA